MCFHSLISMTDKQLAKHFRVTMENMEDLAPQFYINAFTHPKTPVITNVKRNLLQRYQWGLIPSWSKKDEIKKYTLNAKIETLNEKPSFRDSIQNRCMVISNGFYEWKWLDPKGKLKKKYFIKVKNQEVFVFAGIWSHWIHPETAELIKTYTILTTSANPLMAEIHNSKKRMPVIIHPKDYEKWLDGMDIELDANELDVSEADS